MPDSASTDSPLRRLLGWLTNKHAAIRTLEDKAKKALYQENDETAYRELMRDRTEVIAGLGDEAEGFTAALPDADLAAMVVDTLSGFSAGARNALRISSIFYMSALLYPDEHKEGDPDNLERFIRELEGR